MTSKTPLPANTSFRVPVFGSKLNVVQGTDAVGLTASDVAIWNRATVDIAKRQSVVGTYRCLLRYAHAQANLPAFGGEAYSILSAPLGGTEKEIDVNDGVITSDYVTLYIGTGLDTRSSLNLETATNILLDSFLEASTGN